jgi:hypothetical protein
MNSTFTLMVKKTLRKNKRESCFENTAKRYSLSLLALTAILTLQLKTGFFAPHATVLLTGIVSYYGIIKFLNIAKKVMYQNGILLRIQVVICFLLAILSLEHMIMRIIHSKKYIWNIDYRQSYVQSLELERSSEDAISNFTYFGFQSSYHSGHALLAAQIKEIAGLDLDFGLFLFVPLIAFISILFFITAVGRFFKFSNNEIMMVNFTCFFLPTFLFMSADSKPKLIQQNLLGSHLMLNGMLALATIFGIGSISLLRTTKFSQVLVFMYICQISLIAIKPQYIPFSMLFFSMLLILKSHSVAKVIAFALFNFPIILLTSRTSIAPNFKFEIVAPDRDILLLPFALGIFLLVAHLARSDSNKCILREHVVVSFFIAIILFTFVRLLMGILQFQIDVDILSRLQEFWPWADLSVFDYDLEQGFLILYIWVIILFTYSLLRALRLTGLQHRILVLVMTVLVCLSTWSTLQRIIYPINFNEAVATSDLTETLEITPFNARVLVNDIADPADDFQRAGRGEYLAMGGRVSFYLASSMPDHYLAPDYLQRVKAARTFFQNRITVESVKFLEDNSIDFVLINTRCIPVWMDDIKWQNDFPKFILYSREDFIDRTRDSELVEIFAPVPQVKHYGLTDCI